MRLSFSRFAAALALLVTLGTIQSAQAEVREIKKFEEILPFINKDTLVVFDLDNTVIETKQMLGSPDFFGWLMDVARKKGATEAQALKYASDMSERVQPISPVKPPEPGGPKFIRGLQEWGVPVIALTARPGHWAKATLKQLATVNVSFKATSVRADGRAGPRAQGGMFQGVMFQGDDGDKGQYLIQLLSEIPRKFQRVLFVDDKLRNVRDMEAALSQTKIQHISFRYGAADESVKAFDPVVVEFEWNYFLKHRVFIPDHVARWMIENRNWPQAM